MSSRRVTLSSQEEGMSSDKDAIIRFEAYDEADTWIEQFKEVSESIDISDTTAILYILYDIMNTHKGIEELIVNNNLEGIVVIENIEHHGDSARSWASKFCKRIISSPIVRKKLKKYSTINALYTASKTDEDGTKRKSIMNFLKHAPFAPNGQEIPDVSKNIHFQIADTLGGLKLVQAMSITQYFKLAAVRFFPKIVAEHLWDFTVKWDPEKIKPKTPEFEQYCDMMFDKIDQNHEPIKGDQSLKRKREFNNGKNKKQRFNKKNQQGKKPNEPKSSEKSNSASSNKTSPNYVCRIDYSGIKYGNKVQFILDTGAEKSIVNTIDILTDVSEEISDAEGTFVFANGSTAKARHKGKLLLNFYNLDIILEHVYVLPQLNMNVIAGADIIDKGYRLTINRIYTWATKLSNNKSSIIATRKKGTNLIFMLNKEEAKTATTIGSEIIPSEKLFTGAIALPTNALNIKPPIANPEQRKTLFHYHLRYNHMSLESLEFAIKSENIVINRKINDKERLEVRNCHVCKAVNVKNGSHTGSRITARRRLFRIHADTIGPITVHDKKYYITSLIDEFSDYCATVWTEDKKVTDFVVNTLKRWNNLFPNERIAFYRSDNARELIDIDKLNEFGISFDRIPSYTPQLNGVAERHNQTLINMIRKIMIYVGKQGVYQLMKHIVEYVSDIKNRTPIRSRKGKSPYTLFWRKEHYHFEPYQFGVDVVVKLPRSVLVRIDPDIDKTSPQSIDCFLVGFGDSAKAYKVMFYKNRNVQTQIIDQEFDTCNIRFQHTMNNLKRYVKDQHWIVTAGYDPTINGRFEDIYQALTGVSEQDIIDSLALGPANLLREDSDSEETPRASGGKTTANAGNVVSNISTTRRITNFSLNRWDLKNNPRYKKKPDVLNEKFNKYSIGYDTLGHACNFIDHLGDNLVHSNGHSINMVISNPDLSLPEWKTAMQSELDKFKELDVFKIVDLPNGITPITSRWVHTRKENDLKQAVCKSRLVIHGFKQIPELHFDVSRVSSPVVGLTTIRIILAIAATNGWYIHHMDIASAYLNAHLQPEHNIYVKPPKGVDIQPGKCWLLNKSVYGLKQAGFEWFKHMKHILIKLGFDANKETKGIFTRKQGENTVIIALYVDDILITASSETSIEKVYQELSMQLQLKYFGRVSEFLGIQFVKTDDGYEIHQAPNITDLASQLASSRRYRVLIPMVDEKTNSNPNGSEFFEITEKDEDRVLDAEGIKHYQSLVGSLLWVAENTRPDISYAVNRLSQHNSKPTDKHMKKVEQCIRYLDSTKDITLSFRKPRNSSFNILAYSDASFAPDLDRYAISGTTVYINGNLVAWKTRKQKTVSDSATSSELKALHETTKIVLNVRTVLKDLDITTNQAKVLEDNTAAIALCYNTKAHAQRRVTDIELKFVRQFVENNTIAIEYIESKQNIADMLTKALPRAQFKTLRDKLFSTNTSSGAYST